MAASDAPALEARGLTKRFGRRGLFGGGAPVTAVDRVTLGVSRGETLGIVGESGSGKSTIARMMVGLLAPDEGEVALAGAEIDVRSHKGRKVLRHRVQFVFQDPAGAFNPRRTIGEAIEAPLIGLLGRPRAERRERVAELLEQVGLRPDHAARFPHAFSGGQLQRVGIARALAAEPGIVALDEPVSALDVSVQAQILALLRKLREERGLTMIFVSHDLAVVEALCDRVAVMRRGRIIEEGPCREVLSKPCEGYTRALLDAARGVAA
ncbi:ABC transporter ATP-binding protein [Hansschlegelia zhihuaiae]|uniref:ABC transporter ATP-binding protein n=1 Tax=Hansschlegelia zhihuaiae TaxID=405005 RepID=A0A4Q0MLX7_9HYPH|nr:ATP-binding cassette domain-containing protein [Hansschlegelia zhihuaiae]RXF74445.1 ABC transporter ATP-binding protein [Hansschlegelia zhihuaiae]